MNDAARFWAKVERTSTCWLWTGAKDRGYGKMYRSSGTVRAHRFSYELHHGTPPPAGLLHTCDNPSCVNPKHLVSGTQADNIADAKAKGRIAKGTKHYNVKLTEAQVKDIRMDTRLQREIAADYGISRQHVGAIKRGRVSTQGHSVWAGV